LAAGIRRSRRFAACSSIGPADVALRATRALYGGRQGLLHTALPRPSSLDAEESPPEQTGAGQLKEAEKILGLLLVPGHEATAPHEPGKEPLDVPATAVAAERTPVLRLATARRVVWRDHLDVSFGELGIQPVAVVGHVADEAFGQSSYEAALERIDDELALSSLTTRNPAGDWKTVAVCHCHDLGRFATSSSPNQSAPLLAPAWVPST
jgi:hypothetical protein